ncbi:hypothetical protein CEXT_214801 [Caerostris extrusa]|uniref:Uncharacterized protein n=1 Tax=Caerostris extrusa TaxID=172846 RepID=A0AAV4YFA8_CAEEX|nr:hypothetical protein CEXT_214801 [Caerostris extrusa]
MFSKVWAHSTQFLNPKPYFSLRPEDKFFFFPGHYLTPPEGERSWIKGTFSLTHKAEESEIENDGFSCPIFPDTSPFASQCTDF